MSLLATLQALPAAGQAESVHTQLRALSHTPRGREVAMRFTLRAAELLVDLSGDHAAWCVRRVQEAAAEGSWRHVFEASGDLANTLAYHLHRELPVLPWRTRHEYWQNNTRRNAEVGELCARVLADATLTLEAAA